MKKLETFGWIIFVLSSVFFLVSGILAADGWVIAGSTLFLIGVVALWVAFSNRS